MITVSWRMEDGESSVNLLCDHVIVSVAPCTAIVCTQHRCHYITQQTGFVSMW